jgi:membrane protease YdiL (CAAX protease family)
VSLSDFPPGPGELPRARPISEPVAPPAPLERWVMQPAGRLTIVLMAVIFVAGVMPIGLTPLVVVVLESLGLTVSFAWAALLEKVVGGAAALALIGGLREWLGLPAAAWGLRIGSLKHEALWTLATIGLGIGAWIAGTVIVAALIFLFPALLEDIQQRAKFLGELPLDHLGFAAVLMVVVALQEELLFRALLVPVLKGLTRSWILAVVLSSALFGSLHFAQGVLAIPQTMLLALAYGTAFVLSRSIIPVVAAHFFHNYTMVLLMNVFGEQLEQLTPPMPDG